MKSVFFSKTLLWRITFTLVALLALFGLVRINQFFTSFEVKDTMDSISLGEQQLKEVKTPNIAKKEEQSKTTGEKPQFFIEYRMQRDRARGQQIDLLREIINNGNSSADVRQEAQKRLLHISQLLEKEMEIENMIRAKNFKDAVVFLQDKTATVIVQVDKFAPDEEKKIREIVNRTAGIKEAEVVIIPKAQ